MYRSRIGALLPAFLLLPLGGCSDDQPAQPAPPATMDIVIPSSGYLNNRFFRLDLAPPGTRHALDQPGRDVESERIDPASIHVFKLLPPGEEPAPQDIANLAAYPDTTGVFWTAPGCPPNDFSTPAVHGFHWREVTFHICLDRSGNLDAIDMGYELTADDVLAVTYTVIDLSGASRFKVGDEFYSNPTVEIPGESGMFYRVKLLKASPSGPSVLGYRYAFNYVERNVYSLGMTCIDPGGFWLAIEADVPYPVDPAVNEVGLPYLRLFGLDRFDVQGAPGPDGLVDINDPFFVNLYEGLLRFPMEEPFNAGWAAHAEFADSPLFEWESTYLEAAQAPGLYDSSIPLVHYPQFRRFLLRATYRFVTPDQGDASP